MVPGKSSLVLYKRRPARVLSVADKLEIELEDGKTQRVRPKDVTLLHPGPLDSLAQLTVHDGEVEDAWEILAGGSTELPELAELVFGTNTPSTSWAAWQLVDEGLYFHGTPAAIQVRSAEDLGQVRSAREAKVAEAEAWSAFMKRLQDGKPLGEDDKRLNEVEAMALGRSRGSRILRELGRQETPEAAHALLLRLRRWGDGDNPHPRRLNLASTPPALELPPLPDEDRRDLTHLEAFAIDDAGNVDPDDAVSLDDGRLWVHVADVAALVRPDEPADVEARARGASLYLPETTVPMLPHAATHLLGLGLDHVSPALSFGLSVDAAGEVVDCEVVPSMIRGTRLSYEEVDKRLAEAAFADLLALAERHRQRRLARGAATIDLPEVKVRVEDGEVRLTALPRLRSRQMVTEAMLMAGQGAARFAMDRDIPIPFTTQAPPDTLQTPEGMAAMFAYRKKLQRSRMKTAPAPHAGLGLEVYAQATSPLRRYLDLVVHQQLRASLRGQNLLTGDQVLDRIGSTEAAVGSVRQGERLSNRHWTLVYLRQHPDWEGDAVVVDKRGRRGAVMIPALGLDASMQLPGDPPLDAVIRAHCTGVDLPGLTAHFRGEVQAAGD
jgi:exoribonuclease-2